MEVLMIHICTVCGYEYHDDVEMMSLDRLPDDWRCPECGAPKNVFQAIRREDFYPEDA
jgi:rubredoxin